MFWQVKKKKKSKLSVLGMEYRLSGQRNLEQIIWKGDAARFWSQRLIPSKLILNYWYIVEKGDLIVQPVENNIWIQTARAWNATWVV